MKVGTAVAAVAAAMVTASAAMGAMYNQTLTENGYATADDGFTSKYDPFSLTFTNMPEPIGPATLTLYVTGDIGGTDEYFFVSFGGQSLGLWLNSNSGDDLITGTDGGSETLGNTGYATFDEATLMTLMVGDTVELYVSQSGYVNHRNGTELFSATLEYEYVPEPASMLLLGLGLLFVRRR